MLVGATPRCCPGGRSEDEGDKCIDRFIRLAGGKPTLVGLKENQRINPRQSKLPPAEGVTPPAEVHACPTVHSAPCTTRYRCLPTGVTGSRSRPTPPGFHPTASLIDISAFLAAVAIECIE
jgi:hypothetical protein